jgi:pyruvate dehydrogenase E2 component (dihydrolipoamide acetyltransferase)
MPELMNAKTVHLPSLGADMDVGTVVEWCVAVGDEVQRGDIVAIVSTEKSDIDVESWDTGVVAELVAPIGVEIEVGQPLLVLTTDPSSERPQDHTPSAGSRPANVVEESVAAERPEQPGQSTRIGPPEPQRPPAPSPLSDMPGRVAASPFARRIAAERGISLDSVHGSGQGGAVVAGDLPVATEAGPEGQPKPEPGRADTVDPMRRIIGERMSRANAEIPHYHLERDIDMAPALEWLADHNDGLPITERVVPAALLACAVARAARAVPQLNGEWIDDNLVASPGVDLAVVVSLRTGGLVTPTVVGADAFDPDQMMTTIRDMVTRARKGQLRGSWMSPASITITNLGDNGADRVDGIIFPPQVALVGFGRISERPWIVDGDVVARPVVTASLAADHRASDGADGSRFLAVVADSLEHPEVIGR